jgi:hypothetical protein
MTDLLGALDGKTTACVVGATAWLVVAYLLLTWESRQPGSADREDGQLGLKLVALYLFVLGLAFAADGVAGFAHSLLAGAQTGMDALKASIAGAFAGGAAIFVVGVLVLPRTNARAFSRATRSATGLVAAGAGALALVSFRALLAGLILGAPWATSASGAAATVVYGAIAAIAVSRLGALSGWVAVAPTGIPPTGPIVAPPGAAYPPPSYGGQGGYGAYGGSGPAGGAPPAGGQPPR